MIYQNLRAYSDMAGPVRAIADTVAAALAHPPPGMSGNGLHRASAAICELVSRSAEPPSVRLFGIDTVDIGGRGAEVRETAVHRTPFCTPSLLEKKALHKEKAVAALPNCHGHIG